MTILCKLFGHKYKDELPWDITVGKRKWRGYRCKRCGHLSGEWYDI